MSGKAGRLILIKAKISSVWTDIGGLREKELTLNDQLVDGTSNDSGGFREIVQGAGTQSCSISGNGLFEDSACENFLRNQWLTRQHPEMQFVFPDGFTLEGFFMISNIKYAGGHEKEANYSMSFESDGEFSVT